MKTHATIIWLSKNKHWVVTQQDDGEGSVFENGEDDLEVGDKLFADWSADSGDEEIFSENLDQSFRGNIQGRFPSWRGALKSGKEWAGEV